MLRYTGGLPPGRCSERCAVTNAGECYAADTCRNRCDVMLRVDGAAQPAATRHADGEYAGEERVVWRAVPARAAEREYEVVMPWGAVVELVRLELRGSGWGAPRLLPPPPARSFVYAAYGDSITHGWCGATPYPELIAARHGWQSVNLGIPGMGAVGGAHGAAIAAVGAQLVSVAIGINDIFWCGAVGEPLRQTLVGIRARQPRVPLVVVTPTPSYMDGKRARGPTAAARRSRASASRCARRCARGGAAATRRCTSSRGRRSCPSRCSSRASTPERAAWRSSPPTSTRRWVSRR